jgi:hypothetical protein
MGYKITPRTEDMNLMPTLFTPSKPLGWSIIESCKSYQYEEWKIKIHIRYYEYKGLMIRVIIGDKKIHEMMSTFNYSIEESKIEYQVKEELLPIQLIGDITSLILTRKKSCKGLIEKGIVTQEHFYNMIKETKKLLMNLDYENTVRALMHEIFLLHGN